MTGRCLDNMMGELKKRPLATGAKNKGVRPTSDATG
jgi:hypothetical protein